MLILDASIILSLLLDDENAVAGQAVVDAANEHTTVAPSILWYEVRNALVVSERRKRLTPEKSKLALDTFALLPIKILSTTPSDRSLVLARKHGLTIYDAAYLDLAIEHSGFLATLDHKLLTAAHKEDIESWSDVLAGI